MPLTQDGDCAFILGVSLNAPRTKDAHAAIETGTTPCEIIGVERVPDDLTIIRACD